MKLPLSTLAAAAHGNTLRIASTASPSVRATSIEAARAPRAKTAPAPAEPRIDTSFSLDRVLRPQVAQRWMLPYLSAITPQYIESVLRQALAGNHVQAWELFDLMLDTDPEIAACCQEFTEGVLRKKLIVEPYTEEDAEPTPDALERSRVVSAALRRMRAAPDCDENNLRGTLRDIVSARWFGTSVLEIDFRTDADENGQSDLNRLVVNGVGEIIAPRTTFWVHPVCYGWSEDARLGLRVGALGDRRSVSRRDYSRASQRGTYGSSLSSLGSLSQQFNGIYGGSSATLERFPKHKFLISVFKAKSGSVLAGSVLRPLAWWWCASNFCGDWLLNLAQLFGIPFRKAHYASGTSESIKQEIRDMLQNAGSAGYILLPQGADMEYVFGQLGASQSPQAFLFEFADRQKRKVILGQTMSGSSGTTGKGGGQAFGEVEADVKGNKIDSAGEDACAVLNDQLIPAILAINYGDDSDAPTVRLLDEEEGTLQDAQRDEVLSRMGLTLSERFLRKKYGQPAPQKKDALVAAQPQALPANRADAEKKETEKESPAEASASPRLRGDLEASDKEPDFDAIAQTVNDVIAPILKRVRAIAAVTDPEMQRALLEKLLRDQPAIRAAILADPSLAKAITPEMEQAFAGEVLKRNNAPVEASDDSTAGGVWRTINGTHVFIKDGQSVEDAVKERFGSHKQKTTSEQDEAIAIYQDGGYQEINRALREGWHDELEDGQKSVIRDLDEATKQNSLPSHSVLFRSGIPTETLKALKPGDVLADKAFQSTSFLSSSTEVSDIHFGKSLAEIRAPAGTKGVFVSGGEKGYNTEKEFLLPRNTKLKFVGMNGKRFVFNIEKEPQ